MNAQNDDCEDETLPEAQRIQGIDSRTWVISPAKKNDRDDRRYDKAIIVMTLTMKLVSASTIEGR